MTKTRDINNSGPILPEERYAILDILRGLALAGICLANFPEFSLYTFLREEVVAGMPTARVDQSIRFLQYVFIDGKFYTLFSLLFGIGFSIIISNAERKHADGYRIFYRRMAILFIIGMAHLMLLWSGDILMLYALAGLFLPLFRYMSNRKLLLSSTIFLLLPVGVDALLTLTSTNPSAPVVRMQHYFCARYGITESNFAYWLKDAHSYTEVLQFLVQGAFERMQEFIEGNRFLKVMGLFLLGFYIGRNRLYARLTEEKPLLKRMLIYTATIGFPISLLYAWSAINGRPWGQTTHSILYAISIYPQGIVYAAAVCLWYLRHKENPVFRVFAAPGRMALTNYIGQSVWGIFIFYGVGMGFGADMGLIYVLLVAAGVYGFEILFSLIWLHYYRFGPLEWVWRMLTYGKWFKLIK